MKTQTNSRKYEGQCRFCRQDFSKRQINQHLDECAKRKQDEKTTSLRLKIFDPDILNLWLIVEVNDEAKLKDLDKLIRDVWVECCGHLSQFGDYGNQVGKTRLIMDVLEPGDNVGYTYDFGTSTDLVIEALGYNCHPLEKKVELVARNYQPASDCVKCGKQAELVCAYCADEEVAMVCGECGEEYHDEEDESGEHYLMPLANSPRSGMCGYEPPAPLNDLF